MKTKLLLVLTMLALLLQNCKKDETPPVDHSQLNVLVDSAKAFLTFQQQLLSNSLFIDTLNKNANWDKVSVDYDVVHKQTIVYIPVNYNDNITGMIFEIETGTNAVQDAYLIEIPLSFSANSPGQFISAFYGHKQTFFDATISAYSLDNSFMWEVSYKNGTYQYKKYIADSNGLSNRSSSQKVTGCQDWYLVTYYSDGSKDMTYLFTTCDCHFLRQITREAPYSMGVQDCATGGSTGGGGSGGTTTVSKNNPNKVVAQNSSAQASLTKLSNGMIHAIATNTGLFLLANVNVTFNFNPATKTLDATSVSTSIANGFIVGTWKQQDVTDIYTLGNDIFFSIHSSVEISVPGLPGTVMCPYIINVDYNTASNTAYFTNVDKGPFKS